MWAYIVGGIFGLLVIVYLYYYVRQTRRCWKLMEKLPTPKALPFLGHALLFCLSDYETVFRTLRKWSKEFGPIYNVALPGYATANITAAEEFELVASGIKNITKSDVYILLAHWLGEGLLTSTGNLWQTRRKILTPAFHFGILQEFVGVFTKETQNLVEVLKEMDGDCINIVPLISQHTLKIITETAMGAKLNLQNAEDKNFVSATFDIGKIFFLRLFRPWLHFQNVYYNLTPMGYRETKLIRILHSFCDKIIAEKSKKFEESGLFNYSERKKRAMLDILLNTKMQEQSIDEQGIKDEVNTFMFEGHDTTAVSICFTIMLLAYHKEAQDLIYEEILEVLGNSDQLPTINELNELKYMERCIKESLRLYPSVPFISRVLEEDITTENGYTIPEQTIVNIHIYDIHRNPKYWSDPDKFDPDRFLLENCLNRHPFAYVPFSAGPRNCIGQKFAILEQKAVLCGILKKFKLQPIHTPETLVIIQDMLLRPKDEIINLKFVPRK